MNKNDSTSSSSGSGLPFSNFLFDKNFKEYENSITFTICIIGLTSFAVEEKNTLLQPRAYLNHLISDQFKGGSGKSCLCSRLFYPSEQIYKDGSNHSTYISPQDFSGSVINNDNFIYWGQIAIKLEQNEKNNINKPNYIILRIVEQTEFIDDNLIKPFRSGKKINEEPYYKRCCSIKLCSNEKLMYICKDQLALEHEYEQIYFPNGKVEVDGFIICCDVSYFLALFDKQLSQNQDASSSISFPTNNINEGGGCCKTDLDWTTNLPDGQNGLGNFDFLEKATSLTGSLTASDHYSNNSNAQRFVLENEHSFNSRAHSFSSNQFNLKDINIKSNHKNHIHFENLTKDLLEFQNKFLETCLNACRKSKKPSVLALTKVDLLFYPDRLKLRDSKNSNSLHEDLMLLSAGDGSFMSQRLAELMQTTTSLTTNPNASRDSHIDQKADAMYETGNELLKVIKNYMRQRFPEYLPSLAPFVATSARCNVNVGSPFLVLAKLILKSKGITIEESDNKSSSSSPAHSNIVVVKNTKKISTIHLDHCSTIMHDHTYKYYEPRMKELNNGIPCGIKHLQSLSAPHEIIPFKIYTPIYITTTTTAAPLPFHSSNKKGNSASIKSINSPTCLHFNSSHYKSYLTKQLRIPLFREALTLNRAIKSCAYETLHTFYRTNVVSYKEPRNFKDFSSRINSCSRTQTTPGHNNNNNGTTTLASSSGDSPTPSTKDYKSILQMKNNYSQDSWPKFEASKNGQQQQLIQSSTKYNTSNSSSTSCSSSNIGYLNVRGRHNITTTPTTATGQQPIELEFGLYVLGKHKCGLLFSLHRTRLKLERIYAVTKCFLDLFNIYVLKSWFPSLKSLQYEKSWSTFYQKNLLINPKFLNYLDNTHCQSTQNTLEDFNDLTQDLNDSKIDKLVWYESEIADELLKFHDNAVNKFETGNDDYVSDTAKMYIKYESLRGIKFPALIFETEQAKECYQNHYSELVANEIREKAKTQFHKLLDTLSSPPPAPSLHGPSSNSYPSVLWAKTHNSCKTKETTNHNRSNLVLPPVILPGQPLNQITLERMLTLKACRECLQLLTEQDVEIIYSTHQEHLIARSIARFKDCLHENWDAFFGHRDHKYLKNFTKKSELSGNFKDHACNFYSIYEKRNATGHSSNKSNISLNNESPLGKNVNQIQINHATNLIGNDIRYRCLDLLATERQQIIRNFILHTITLTSDHCFFNQTPERRCVDKLIEDIKLITGHNNLINLKNVSTALNSFNLCSNDSRDILQPRRNQRNSYQNHDSLLLYSTCINKCNDKHYNPCLNFDIFVMIPPSTTENLLFQQFKNLVPQSTVKVEIPSMATTFDVYPRIQMVELDKSHNTNLNYNNSNLPSHISDLSITKILKTIAYTDPEKNSLHSAFIILCDYNNPKFESQQLRDLLLDTFNRLQNLSNSDENVKPLSNLYEAEEDEKIKLMITLLNCCLVFVKNESMHNTSPQIPQPTSIHPPSTTYIHKNDRVIYMNTNYLCEDTQNLCDFASKYYLPRYLTTFDSINTLNIDDLSYFDMGKIIRKTITMQKTLSTILNHINKGDHFMDFKAEDNYPPLIFSITICFNCGDCDILETVKQFIGAAFGICSDGDILYYLQDSSCIVLFINTNKNSYNINVIVKVAFSSYHGAWAFIKNNSCLNGLVRDNAYLLTYDTNSKSSFNIMNSFLKRLSEEGDDGTEDAKLKIYHTKIIALTTSHPTGSGDNSEYNSEYNSCCDSLNNISPIPYSDSLIEAGKALAIECDCEFKSISLHERPNNSEVITDMYGEVISSLLTKLLEITIVSPSSQMVVNERESYKAFLISKHIDEPAKMKNKPFTKHEKIMLFNGNSSSDVSTSSITDSLNAYSPTSIHTNNHISLLKPSQFNHKNRKRITEQNKADSVRVKNYSQAQIPRSTLIEEFNDDMAFIGDKGMTDHNIVNIVNGHDTTNHRPSEVAYENIKSYNKASITVSKLNADFENILLNVNSKGQKMKNKQRHVPASKVNYTQIEKDEKYMPSTNKGNMAKIKSGLKLGKYFNANNESPSIELEDTNSSPTTVTSTFNSNENHYITTKYGGGGELSCSQASLLSPSALSCNDSFVTKLEALEKDKLSRRLNGKSKFGVNQPKQIGNGSRAKIINKTTNKSATLVDEARNGIDDNESDPHIPKFLRICLDHIEKEGISCEGIYRIPGSKVQVERFMNKLSLSSSTNSKFTIKSTEYTINVVGTAVKTYLTDLKDPLLHQHLIESMLEIGNMTEISDKILTWKDILLNHKSTINYELIKFFICHLNKVSKFEDLNCMSSRNLAICFWPTLTRPDFTDYESMALSAKPLEEALYILIEHYNSIME